jgi:hypothetical protein
MAAAYRIVTVDLSVPADKQPINRNVPANVTGDGFRSSQVAFITVLQAPAGSGFLLHIGDGGEGIILGPVGRTYEMCPPETGGVFFTLPAASGGSMVLLLSFAEGSIGVG